MKKILLAVFCVLLLSCQKEEQQSYGVDVDYVVQKANELRAINKSVPLTYSVEISKYAYDTCVEYSNTRNEINYMYNYTICLFGCTPEKQDPRFFIDKVKELSPDFYNYLINPNIRYIGFAVYDNRGIICLK